MWAKPVYALFVLPFEHEEVAELRSVYNTAVCLKSIQSVADGVFLADNQRYVRKDASMATNLSRINVQIAEPFYDLLCAGEVTKYKNVGAKTLDAGDIIQSIDGWTTIGVGSAEIPRGFRFPWEVKRTTSARRAVKPSGRCRLWMLLSASFPLAAILKMPAGQCICWLLLKGNEHGHRQGSR